MKSSAMISYADLLEVEVFGPNRGTSMPARIRRVSHCDIVETTNACTTNSERCGTVKQHKGKSIFKRLLRTSEIPNLIGSIDQLTEFISLCPTLVGLLWQALLPVVAAASHVVAACPAAKAACRMSLISQEAQNSDPLDGLLPNGFIRLYSS